MAQPRTNRSESDTQSNKAIARSERERTSSSLQRWPPFGSPFELMDRMNDEMDRMFERVFGDVAAPRRSWLSRLSGSPAGRGLGHGIWSPRVEAFQKEDRFIVRAELPGLKREDVNIEVTGDSITIHGERREEREEERDGYYHSEREYGQFHRTIPLPEGAISDSARATFRNGVLEISMQAPPAEATRGRKLEIGE